MRYIVVLTLVVVFSLGYALKEVQAVRGFLLRSGADLREYYYDPEVVFNLKDNLIEDELRSLLPAGKSILWWGANTAEVEAKLLKHPVVGAVSIERCSTIATGCFQVNVQKRSVRAVAFVGRKPWLIDREGAFIVPVVDKTNLSVVRSLEVDPADLPVFKGVSQRVESPEIIQARLHLAVKALDVIEEITKSSVKALEFSARGEMSIHFQSYPFRAVFSPAQEGVAGVREEARRLVAVLSKADVSIDDIEQVDLAFQRSAVVRYRGDEEESDSSGRDVE